jgi:hypothetical protein
MADEADLAFDSEQRHLTQALAQQRRRRGVLQPTGCCHHCGNEEGLADRLFCDADCASDWEYEDTLRRRLGLPAMAAPGRAATAMAA